MPQNVDPESAHLHIAPRVQIETIPEKLAGATVTLRHGSIDRAEGCHCQLLLEVPFVVEDDTLTNLEVRWFLDYDPHDPLLLRPAVPSEFIQGSFDVNAPTLRPGPSFTMDPDAFGIADGVHVVDMVVAERFDNPTTFPANRAIPATYESATYRFVVNVITDNTQRCQAQAPWKRVCPTSADGGTP